MPFIIFHLSIIGISFIGLLSWIHFAIWKMRLTHKEGIGSLALASIIPLLCLFPIGVTTWALRQTVVSPLLRHGGIGGVIVLSIVTIALSALFSIKKYRKDGLTPNYAAFGFSCFYVSLVTVICACLLF